MKIEYVGRRLPGLREGAFTLRRVRRGAVRTGTSSAMLGRKLLLILTVTKNVNKTKPPTSNVTKTLTKTNQDCNEDFHTELEPHSHQRLDLDDGEREEFDSELRLELDYPTELQQQDQTGTLHSIKTLEQFKKSSARFITSQTWPAVRISISSSQGGDFEHVLERIRMSSAKLQHETYGVHTPKVVFNNFLLLAELRLISLGWFENSQTDSICFAIGDEFESQNRKKNVSSSTKSLKKYVGVLKRIYSAL